MAGKLENANARNQYLGLGYEYACIWLRCIFLLTSIVCLHLQYSKIHCIVKGVRKNEFVLHVLFLKQIK